MRGGPLISRSLCQGEDAQPCARHLRKYVLAVAVLGSAMGFIDGTIITVAVQPIRAAFGATFADIQWVVNGYTLALAAFLLVGGAAGDRYGKRRLFGLGIATFAAASMACALAPTVETLIAARVAQGLGAAMLVPGSLALIAVNFPAAERGRAVGIWAAASGITTAIGPLVGGALIDLGSWRAIFFVNIPIAAIALALLYARVPADTPTGSGRFDIMGATLAFVAVGTMAFGLTLAEREGLSDPLALASAALGVLLAAAFLWFERRTASPMMPLDLFASRTFSVANAQTGLLYFALTGAVFFLPITMMEAYGASAVLAGAVFVPFTATMALVAPISGRLSERIGARILLSAGPLVVAAAFVALAAAVRAQDFWTGIAPAMAAFGIGMGLTIPPLSTAVLNDAGEARTGIASGVNNAISRIAGLFAIAVLGLAATLLYRLSLGVEGIGFAADAPGATPAARSEAVIATFSALAHACAALCVAAALLALILPRIGAGATAAAGESAAR